MFAAVTTNAAKVMGLNEYGLQVGKRADFVILQARDPIEAIRLRAARLYVIRAGKVLARTPPVQSELTLGPESHSIDWLG